LLHTAAFFLGDLFCHDFIASALFSGLGVGRFFQHISG
jgi:hypothetical protein